jgi:hypothetical protein
VLPSKDDVVDDVLDDAKNDIQNDLQKLLPFLATPPPPAMTTAVSGAPVTTTVRLNLPLYFSGSIHSQHMLSCTFLRATTQDTDEPQTGR